MLQKGRMITEVEAPSYVFLVQFSLLGSPCWTADLWGLSAVMPSGQEPNLTEKSARLRKLVYVEYIIG